MRPQTRFLSRMFGMYCLVMGFFVMTHREAMLRMVLALIADKPLMFVMAMLLVFAGLAMVLEHNIWKGGALPVVVTVLSWWTLGKGVLVLYIGPEKLFTFFFDPDRYARIMPFDAVFILLLGAYLTYKGFEAPQMKHA